MRAIFTTCRAAETDVLTYAARANPAARRWLLSSLAVLFFLAMPAQGALVSFVSTNSAGEPDTNILKAIPVSGPVAHADGSFTTIGLPIRIYPDANGRATNLLAQNNYQITNAYQNYYIRVPLDSGNTVYPSGQLLISGNYGNANVFVTIGLGITNLPTYNQVTNIFGGAPLLQTNLPSLTNGFITLLEATNVSKTSTFNASNSLYLDYTTRIAVLSALSMTNAFATNAPGVQLLNHQLFISTNYDALGTALAIGVTASNYTFAVSNALAAQIGAAGVSAPTATNIAAFQAQKVTNGFIALLDATNVFNGKIGAATNGFIALPDSTNVFNGKIATATNGFIAKLDATNIFNALSVPGITNAFATNAAGVQLISGRIFISTNYDALGAAAMKANTNAPTIWTPLFSGLMNLTNGQVLVNPQLVFNSQAITNTAVLGGRFNFIIASNNPVLGSTIAGGISNVIGEILDLDVDESDTFDSTETNSVNFSGIGGGRGNTLMGNFSFIGGGDGNAIAFAPGNLNPDYSFMGGGFRNTNNGSPYSVIVGGQNNYLDDGFAGMFIGGGRGNTMIGGGGQDAFIGGGKGNQYTGTDWGTLVGGLTNKIDGLSNQEQPPFGVTIGGGLGNTVGRATSSDDAPNRLSGATVPGGITNRAAGFGAFAAGVGSLATNDGAFVWSDSQGGGNSTSSNQFVVRARGGVYFQSGILNGNGSGLTNLQVAGLSTNGSAALQVPTSIGGVVKFTNITSILGTDYTNGFIAPPDLQASLGSGTNTYTGHFSNLTNTGVLVFGTFGSVFQESLLGGNWTLNLTPHSNGTFKVNGNFLVGSNITANLFIGDGSGLTNTTSTNLALGALAQVTNIASSLASSNAFLFGNKLNRSNDTSYGQSATNFATLGNVAFGRDGQATNIISSTNFLYFVNAGSGIVTNGAFVWMNGMASYTNWLTGASMTNNGSAWLLQTNGVTLYSLAGTSPIGTYAAVNGALPAPTAFYTAAINDHMVMLGYFSVSNLQQQFASAGASNAIANLNGFGTNAFLTWSGVSTQNFFTAQFGISNVTASPYSVILGGTRNWISNFQDAAVIVGGISNTIVGFTEISPYSAIYGGLQNSINQSRQTAIFNGQSDLIDSGSEMSQILGGLGNSIGTSGGSNRGNQSTILGGSGNKIIGTVNEPLLFNGLILQGVNDIVSSSFGVAIGRNISLTNASSSLVFSDGTPVTTQTNSSVIFMATNGVGINTNYPAGFALNVNGAINATSISVSKAPVVVNASTIPFTNSSAAGILSTNLGDAANTNLVYSDVNGGMHRASIGSGLSWSATTATLSASGGGGSQTPLAGDVDGAGFGLTNLALEKITNTLSVGGQATVSALIVTNGVTNLATLKVMGNQSNAGTFSVTGNATNFAGAYFPLLTASTLLELDSTKKAASIANPSVAGSYILTNDNNGNMGWAGSLNGSALGAAQFVKTDANTNLVSSLDATGLTNTVPYTNFLTTTNIAIVFDGNMHMGTVTNGPDVWITPSVSGSGSGSWSFEFTTNVNIHLPIPVRWVAGSNGVSANVFAITNGEFDLTAYGGTNYPHLKAAIGENQ